MWIKTLRIENYRAFRDSGAIMLGPKMNVILGRNNSGKSALLEALNLTNCSNRPFLSDLTRTKPAPISSFELELVLTGPEIVNLFRRFPKNSTINVPTPSSYGSDKQEFVSYLLSQPQITFSLRIEPTQAFKPNAKPSHQLVPEKEILGYASFEIDEEGQIGYPSQHEIAMGALRNAVEDNLPSLLTEAITKSIFVFQAQRVTSATSKSEHNAQLNTTAENLPAALASMQGERPNAFRSLIATL
jgi:predicted ATPase